MISSLAQRPDDRRPCGLDQKVKKSIQAWWCHFKSTCTCSPGCRRAFDIGRRHCDIGNDPFAFMLDKWMNDSCAYWKEALDLDAPQEAKMDLIYRELRLHPGMRLLDIGCGWGGLAVYAALRYGVEVVGITVSREQMKPGRERCERLPVTIELMDYRSLNGTFDLNCAGVHWSFRWLFEIFQTKAISAVPPVSQPASPFNGGQACGSRSIIPITGF